MTIKEYRKTVGLTQKQFSELFEIPIDVVKSWDSGRRNPPAWAEKLIIEKLEKVRREEKMKTLPYIRGEEKKIEVGSELYFGQLWDGEGDGEELLQSGAVSPDGENVIAFEIVVESEDPLDAIVRVTGIY